MGGKRESEPDLWGQTERWTPTPMSVYWRWPSPTCAPESRPWCRRVWCGSSPCVPCSPRHRWSRLRLSGRWSSQTSLWSSSPSVRRVPKHVVHGASDAAMILTNAILECNSYFRKKPYLMMSFGGVAKTSDCLWAASAGEPIKPCFLLALLTFKQDWLNCTL